MTATDKPITPVPVPLLSIGTLISGATVIAAIRQDDRPGYLPGLHVVTCWAEQTFEFITWEVAWQAYPGADVSRQTIEGGRWVANAGHYYPVNLERVPGADDRDAATDDAKSATRRIALADMIKRF